MTPSTEKVRLDRWLLAARCYRTRPLAQIACEGGMVRVNGDRGDSSKMVKPGDVVEAERGDTWVTWKIVALDVKRADAAHAQTLYDDLTPSQPASPPPDALRDRGAGRPTKRDARLTRAMKGDPSEL